MPGTTLFTGFIRDLTERRNASSSSGRPSSGTGRWSRTCPPPRTSTWSTTGPPPCTSAADRGDLGTRSRSGRPTRYLDRRAAPGQPRTDPRGRRASNELGEPFEVEYRFPAKDGRWTWVGDHATAVRDEGGRTRLRARCSTSPSAVTPKTSCARPRNATGPSWSSPGRTSTCRRQHAEPT